MDPPFFEEIGASDKLWTNLSLSVQLGWFEQLKPSLCSSPKGLFSDLCAIWFEIIFSRENADSETGFFAIFLC